MKHYIIPNYTGPIGNITKCGRDWTKDEINYMMLCLNNGATQKQITKALNRTKDSILWKLKQIKKNDIGKNIPNIIGKYETNKLFLDFLNPISVLDTHAGYNSYYSKYDIKTLITNDKNKKCNSCTYNMDAVELLSKIKKPVTFDIVDVDPFGQVYDCIDNAIKLANKGIILTYGEFTSKPFHKKDEMGPQKATEKIFNNYGLNSINDFNIEFIIDKTKQIAIKYNKELTVKYKLSSKNKSIWRIYYTINM